MADDLDPAAAPSNGKRTARLLLLLAILVLPSLIYILFSAGRHNITALPYYGERDAVNRTVDGKVVTDTIYHQVPPFTLTDQSGNTFTEKDLEGKIYVTDFMFTTCPTICPKMASQMLHLQRKLEDHTDVMFLSHTVNPQHDTPEVLAEYAKQVHADTSRWVFLTGPRDSIYHLGVRGYLVPAQEDALQPGGFLHSEQFVLVDRNRHIRGFFDGTSLKEVNELIDAIKALKAGEIIEQERREARERRNNK